MLVSGGQILAIDHAVTDQDTILGDGVGAKIRVNTDKIATKDFTIEQITEVSGKLSAELDKKIDSEEAYAAFMPATALDSYSANWNSAYDAVAASADIWNAKQDKLTAGYGIDSTKFAQNIIEVSATGGGGKEYKPGNYISIVGDEISVTGLQPSGYYLSANALDNVSAAWNTASAISSVSGYGYSAWSAVSAYDLSKIITGSYLSANALDSVSATWNEVSSISGYGYSAWSAVSALDFVTGSYLSANALDSVSATWNEVSSVSGYGYSAWSAVSAFDIISDTTDSLSAYYGADAKWHVSAKPIQDILTTEQLSAISSVSSISAIVETHINDTDIHVTTEDKTYWNSISSVSGYGYSAWSAVSAYDLSEFVIGSYLSANALDSVSSTWNEVSSISGYGYSAWSAVSAYDLSEFVIGSYLSANALDSVSSTWNEVSSISGYGYSAWSAVSAGISAGPVGILTSYVDETTNTLIISAKPSQQGAAYTAGDWIDRDKLDQNNIIAVSGYKPLNVADPLYYDVDDETGDVTLKIDGSKLVTSKATIIANGYMDDPQSTMQLSADGITATAPDSYAKDNEWTFTFDKPMLIQVAINADFEPNTAKYYDAYDEVGFNGIQGVTNDIKFTMFGYAPQHFNASTVTVVPTGTVVFSFNTGEDDFIQEIKNPCITIQQI